MLLLLLLSVVVVLLLLLVFLWRMAPANILVTSTNIIIMLVLKTIHSNQIGQDGRELICYHTTMFIVVLRYDGTSSSYSTSSY